MGLSEIEDNLHANLLADTRHQTPDTIAPHFYSVQQMFGMLVVFKFKQSLRSMLYNQSERPPDEEEAGQGIVYQILCSSGKTYIGETLLRRLETLMKEHQVACQREHCRSQHWKNMHVKNTTQSSGKMSL